MNMSEYGQFTCIQQNSTDFVRTWLFIYFQCYIMSRIHVWLCELTVLLVQPPTGSFLFENRLSSEAIRICRNQCKIAPFCVGQVTVGFSPCSKHWSAPWLSEIASESAPFPLSFNCDTVESNSIFSLLSTSSMRFWLQSGFPPMCNWLWNCWCQY